MQALKRNLWISALMPFATIWCSSVHTAAFCDTQLAISEGSYSELCYLGCELAVLKHKRHPITSAC